MRGILPIVVFVLVAFVYILEPDKDDIERDLTLDVHLKSAKTIQPGNYIVLDIALVNNSKTRTYSVVKPGDGSAVGWREPHVFFTAKRKSKSGVWENVPSANIGRCGNFDPNWQKDITELRPGKRLVLKKWLSGPSVMLEFQKPGLIRLYVHYRYGAGTLGKGNPQKPANVGKLKGVPAYEIVSAPIELELVRPLDIVVKVKSPLKVKTKTRLSDILQIDLVNRSEKSIELNSPTLTADARLRLEIRGEFTRRAPTMTEQRTTYGFKRNLRPGKRLAVLGEGEFSNDLDGFWEYAVEDKVKVRAVYCLSTWKSAGIIKSDWVTVSVQD